MSWPTSSVPVEGPLAGVRVLDFSRILAGPYSTSIMGDLGADVIKVERPGTGDETRRWGPPFAENGTAAYFYSCNRNRRSLTLDLKDPEDQRFAQELAAEADVVVENYLPGATERMGIDSARLRAANPRLVYCTISGYGSNSRRASWPAVDFIIQAHAGILSITGPNAQERVKAGVPVADLAAGLFATIGVLAALRTAKETGQGAHVEVSLADACVALLVNQGMNWLIGGVTPQPAGNTHPSIAPYQAVRAADRELALAATSDEQFRRLCEVIDRAELSDDVRFRTNADRVRNRAELETLLEERLSSGRAEDWVARLNGAGVAAAVVNTVSEALQDPDTVKNLVTSASDGQHEFPQIRTPIRFDGAPLRIRSGPPILGVDDRPIRDARDNPS